MKDRARLAKRRHAISPRAESLEQRLVMDASYTNLLTTPLIQDWTDTGQITTDDSWSGVPSIEGYRGDGLATSTGKDPQTVVLPGIAAADTPAGVLDVNANRSDPDTFTTGGVTEFETQVHVATSTPSTTVTDAVVAFQGSGTAQAPFLVFYVNTTGATGVNISYLLRDIDGSTDNAVQPVALQYRVGTTGNFTNIAAGYVADASGGPSTATQTNSVTATLPAAALNQAQVQIRVITTNAVGNDELIGVDNIKIAATNGSSTAAGKLAIGTSTATVSEAGGSVAFNVYRSGGSTGSVTVPYTFTNGTATNGADYTGTNGTLTFADGVETQTITIPILQDTTGEAPETFTLNLGTPTGGATILNARNTATVTIIDDGDTAAFPLASGPLTQNWSNVNLITQDNDWHNVPSIVGFTGFGQDTGNGTDPETILTFPIAGTPPQVQVFANQGQTFATDASGASPNGIAEIDGIADPTIALHASGTGAPAPFLLIALNTTSVPYVNVAYDLRDLDPTSNTNQQFALQYRIGNTGDFINVPAGYVADATDAAATLVTHVSANLPAAAGGQPLVQVRIITSNAPGNDEVVGVDNINVTGSSFPAQGGLTFADNSVSIAEGTGSGTTNAVLTVNRIGGSTGTVTVPYTFTAGTATGGGSDFTGTNGTLTFGPGVTSQTISVPITRDAINEANETFTVTLGTPTGGAITTAPTTATVTILDDDAPVIVLNEVDANPPSVDQPFEYIEISGTPGASLYHTYFDQIDGAGTGVGKVDLGVDLSSFTIGSNGLLIIKSSQYSWNIPAGTTVVTSTALDSTGAGISNNSSTFTLISSPTAIVTNQDLDADNNGTLEALPVGATIIDSFGWTNGTATIYGPDGTSATAVDLSVPALVATTSTPNQATRINGNSTPNTPAAWYSGIANALDQNQSIAYNNTISEQGGKQANLPLPLGVVLSPGAPNVSSTVSYNGNKVHPAEFTLAIQSITPTRSGFVLQFNSSFSSQFVNLYSTDTDPFATPDVTLTGPNGSVNGTLIISNANSSETTQYNQNAALPKLVVTFVATSGQLAPGSYSVGVRGAADSFISDQADEGNPPLDGDFNNSAGGNYATTFTVAAEPNTVVVGVPDFVRGAGQDVNLPGDGKNGIPITVVSGDGKNVTGVTTVSFDLDIDQTLLDITGVVLGPDAPAGTTITGTSFGPTFFFTHYDITIPGPGLTVGATPLDLINLVARVKDGSTGENFVAPYAAKGLLDINRVVINNFAIRGSDDDSVHIASYLGDVDGDQSYTGNDTATIDSVAVGFQSGFEAFQDADPNLIGDLDGDVSVTANDTAVSAALSVGDTDSTPQIPALPAVAGSVPTGGPDPLILLPKGLTAQAGAALSVPVGFKQTNSTAITLHSADLVIGYDASRFTVEGVRSGSLLSGGVLSWKADPSTGLIYITISVGKFAGQTLNPNATGTLAWLDLRAKAGATGSSALNLRADGFVAGALRTTRLNEGTLTLIPAPTDAPDDAVDGSIAIAATSVNPLALLDAALAQYAGVADQIALPLVTGDDSTTIVGVSRPKKLGLITLS